MSTTMTHTGRTDHYGDAPQASDTAQRFKEQATNLGRDVKDLASTAGVAAREQIEPVEQFVQQRPMTSMLVAAGAGLVLGLILRGR